MRNDMGLRPGGRGTGPLSGRPIDRALRYLAPAYPDTIFLFQGPLEEMCETVEELEEQIEITVVHEVAHYIGMDEGRLAELGYG